jgi:hypothetical protein
VEIIRFLGSTGISMTREAGGDVEIRYRMAVIIFYPYDMIQIPKAEAM